MAPKTKTPAPPPPPPTPQQAEHNRTVFYEVARLEGRDTHRRQEAKGQVVCSCGVQCGDVGETANAIYRHHLEDRAIDILGIELSLER